MLLLDYFKGNKNEISLSDFQNFLKHLDEKILFNALEESLYYDPTEGQLKSAEDLRESLIDQASGKKDSDNKNKQLLFFIEKLSFVKMFLKFQKCKHLNT